MNQTGLYLPFIAAFTAMILCFMSTARTAPLALTVATI